MQRGVQLPVESSWHLPPWLMRRSTLESVRHRRWPAGPVKTTRESMHAVQQFAAPRVTHGNEFAPLRD